MSQTASNQPQKSKEKLLTRILNRCISLLPYMSLPGYFPGTGRYLMPTPPNVPEHSRIAPLEAAADKKSKLIRAGSGAKKSA